MAMIQWLISYEHSLHLSGMSYPRHHRTSWCMYYRFVPWKPSSYIKLTEPWYPYSTGESASTLDSGIGASLAPSDLSSVSYGAPPSQPHSQILTTPQQQQQPHVQPHSHSQLSNQQFQPIPQVSMTLQVKME